jgi:hypothetical protein
MKKVKYVRASEAKLNFVTVLGGRGIVTTQQKSEEVICTTNEYNILVFSNEPFSTPNFVLFRHSNTFSKDVICNQYGRTVKMHTFICQFSICTR